MMYKFRLTTVVAGGLFMATLLSACGQSSQQVFDSPDAAIQRMSELIGQYGLPQKWNPVGRLGPDRYIEAQIWDDRPLRKFLTE